MADIFGRMEQVYAGGLTSDASWMFWAGLANGGLGMLITQMQIQYQQPVRRIYEIGPWTSTGGPLVLPFLGLTFTGGQPVYYVAGRPEGQIQLSRITGPVAALGGFYKTYGNTCSFTTSLFFVSSTGCIGGNAIGTARGGVATGQFDAGTPAPRVAPAGRGDPFLGWYMNGCVITNMGLAAQAQDMMVTENIQMMFVTLRLFRSPFEMPIGRGDAAGISDISWTEL